MINRNENEDDNGKIDHNKKDTYRYRDKYRKYSMSR